MEKRGSQLIRSIFDTDNFFMRICEKILDLVTVNLIFLCLVYHLLRLVLPKLACMKLCLSSKIRDA